MTETLDQVVLNPLEDLKISLIKIRGEPHVELRVNARAAPGDASGLPGGRAIVLPVGLVPELLRVMTEIKEVLIKRGRISPPDVKGVDLGQSISARAAGLPNRTDSRQHPRAHLRIPVECRLLDPTTFWPGKWMTGEIRDVSIGGAQVWLPQRFPRFKQVEVFGAIEGTVFRGRAEILGTDLMKVASKNGRYRHSLRWVGLDAQAKTVLSKLVPMTIGRAEEE